MSFYECFKTDLNVSVLCFRGGLGCFCQKKAYFCVLKSRRLPILTQMDRNTQRPPAVHPLHTQESNWNDIEIILEHTWNSQKTPKNHPRNIQINKDIYFTCHNDGHLEKKSTISVSFNLIFCVTESIFYDGVFF